MFIGCSPSQQKANLVVSNGVSQNLLSEEAFARGHRHLEDPVGLGDAS
jgi:hypothetical protein